MSEKPILELVDVYSGYGNITALKGISLKVYRGEIVSIIGANGAGKTTTLMTISGIVALQKGKILYNNQPIHKKSPADLPPMGLCHVPEGRRIFPRLTVEDNLELGAFFRKDKEDIKKDIQQMYTLFPVLKERSNQHGGNLSGGEQQMLAIGRALMSRPKVLLMDEPSLGLAPLFVQKIFQIINEINKNKNTTILLVEQNANIALQTAKRAYVLETGKIIMKDQAKNLLNNPDIKKAYLGE